LSEAQWDRIKDALPGRVEHVGRTAADNQRCSVDATVGSTLARSSGALWQVQERAYAVHALVAGRVWERVFADLVADKKNQYLMIDSTIVRAHQQAATGRKKGAQKTRLWGVPEVD
jgi:hypothetical protein